MRIRFTKMQGIGNDFVMIDALTQKISITNDDARKLADRHFGVGCDQVLVVEAPQDPEMDFRYRIFNHDGSEVENCGNGARCFAVFVRQRGLTSKHTMRVETLGGPLTLSVSGDNQVRVDMGVPVFEPAKIPFQADQQQATYGIHLKKKEFEISALSMGNPHAVVVVDNVEDFPVHKYGPLLETHRQFPRKVNAGFMQILSPEEIKLRVFERGVGETIACGTGACAAVAAGVYRGILANRVLVNLPGGQLDISWEGVAKPVIMNGPAKTVFHGYIRL